MIVGLGWVRAVTLGQAEGQLQTSAGGRWASGVGEGKAVTGVGEGKAVAARWAREGH